MNKLTTFALLLLSISFSTAQQLAVIPPVNTGINIPVSDNGFSINDQDYTLRFDVEQINDKELVLVIAIELHNGSHYISPYAKRDFSGKFYMDLGSYTDLDFDGSIIETPRSYEEFDYHPFVDGNVNWVRVNTTYTQALKVLSEDDFEVFGRVQFTIEPRCTFEEIPFAISYKDGVMKVTSPKC